MLSLLIGHKKWYAHVEWLKGTAIFEVWVEIYERKKIVGCGDFVRIELAHGHLYFRDGVKISFRQVLKATLTALTCLQNVVLIENVLS
jgi:hypothetical protein